MARFMALLEGSIKNCQMFVGENSSINPEQRYETMHRLASYVLDFESSKYNYGFKINIFLRQLTT